jgi:hypothetical protein
MMAPVVRTLSGAEARLTNLDSGETQFVESAQQHFSSSFLRFRGQYPSTKFGDQQARVVHW